MPAAAPATIRFTPVDDTAPEDLTLCAGGEVVDLKEAMRRLKMSRPTIYKAMDSGELAYCQSKAGCRRMIPVAALERFNARRLRRG